MACSHKSMIHEVEPSAIGCVDCLKIGGDWVHLRICLTCGHVGCCDNSPNKHASLHFRETGHPIVQAFRDEEEWRWCYIDKEFVEN